MSTWRRPCAIVWPRIARSPRSLNCSGGRPRTTSLLWSGSGRVLDVTAIVGFCTGKSVYAEALVRTAIEENIVLSIPSAALVRAAALISPSHELGVDVLLGLPCTVVDALDTTRARAVLQGSGSPRHDVAAAHVVHCGRQRGWPVVTSEPEPLLAVDISTEIESLSYAAIAQICSSGGSPGS